MNSSPPRGTDITDVFRLYLRPLLGSKMPDAFRLRSNPVPKRMNRGSQKTLPNVMALNWNFIPAGTTL